MKAQDIFTEMELESQAHGDGHLSLWVSDIVEILDRLTGTLKVSLDRGAYMPERAHDTDAGYDLRTPLRVYLHAHSSAIVDTGVHIQLPPGKCAVVVSKSGLNVNHDITSTGLIDEGFSGAILIKLYNHGDKPYIFEPGEKVSQFYITDYYPCKIEIVDQVKGGARGSNGYGSTGK